MLHVHWYSGLMAARNVLFLVAEGAKECEQYHFHNFSSTTIGLFFDLDRSRLLHWQPLRR
jgi:hypothetical protein